MTKELRASGPNKFQIIVKIVLEVWYLVWTTVRELRGRTGKRYLNERTRRGCHSSVTALEEQVARPGEVLKMTRRPVNSGYEAQRGKDNQKITVFFKILFC